MVKVKGLDWRKPSLCVADHGSGGQGGDQITNLCGGMKEIVIAFDVDGTILNNEGIPPETPAHLRPQCGVNLEIILLIQILSQKMKNTRVIVWSGGGKEYAENICRRYGLDKYVDRCYAKEDCDEDVDICFDDIHACTLAQKNIIVKMK